MIIKNVYFPEVKNITFIPLEQQVWPHLTPELLSLFKLFIRSFQVNSIIRYNGDGFIPCGGVAPAPTDCHFPAYRAKVQRPYPT